MIEFEKGRYGLKAVVRSAWHDSFLELLLDKEIIELELNDGKGWKADNVDFLESLPNLQSLIIIILAKDKTSSSLIFSALVFLFEIDTAQQNTC